MPPGGFYIVQDTRLDYGCAYAVLTIPRRDVWWYCRKLLRFGGPAMAVAKIVATDAFRARWQQDRTVEEWVITQHPGGYFRRHAGSSEDAFSDNSPNSGRLIG